MRQFQNNSVVLKNAEILSELKRVKNHAENVSTNLNINISF